MNAISAAMGDLMPRKTEAAIAILAAYFRSLANRGLGCTTNNASIASALNLSVATVRAAKLHLVKSRRLVGSWQVWHSIDGIQFGRPIENEVESVKTVLRRHFSPVYDSRTETNPNDVPAGEPDWLVVGGTTMTWDEAKALAAKFEPSFGFGIPRAEAAASAGGQRR